MRFLFIFANSFDQGKIITYHLLFDIGEGITTSMEKGISELGLEDSLSIRRLESKSYPSSSATSELHYLLGLQSAQKAPPTSAQPNFDALLITHSHEDHIKDLSDLVKKYHKQRQCRKLTSTALKKSRSVEK